MIKIISVVGARPNFMKIAPFIRAINAHNNAKKSPSIQHILVHTGQHYDDRMSKVFFNDLNIPEADINLGIGSGTHAEQVGLTMIAFEKVLKKEKPDWVIVVGDVNATLACSVTAKKENIKCAHIEAGLRSRDISMPEEINRLVTDRLSDLLFTPDRISNENLFKEGISEDKIKFVGNIMIDTLESSRGKASNTLLKNIIAQNLLHPNNETCCHPTDENFAVVTLHRPSNVDDRQVFTNIVDFLTTEACSDLSVIWPIHPRAKKQLLHFGLWGKIEKCNNMVLLEPVNYIEMLRLNIGAKLVLTDSGGLQEECTVLGTPCLTLRWNTERPVTLREKGGVSVLVGNDITQIRKEYQIALKKERKPVRPQLWDGKTAERIVSILTQQ